MSSSNLNPNAPDFSPSITLHITSGDLNLFNYLILVYWPVNKELKNSSDINYIQVEYTNNILNPDNIISLNFNKFENIPEIDEGDYIKIPGKFNKKYNRIYNKLYELNYFDNYENVNNINYNNHEYYKFESESYNIYQKTIDNQKYYIIENTNVNPRSTIDWELASKPYDSIIKKILKNEVLKNEHVYFEINNRTNNTKIFII